MCLDGNDYSIEPRVIGRFVDVHATLTAVVATCAGQEVARHQRDWGSGRTVTDPAHQQVAKALRADLATARQQPPRQGHQHGQDGRDGRTRVHTDGHVVAIRALPDYDVLFGVDFDPRPTPGAASAGGS